jgi:hypothetical protein
MENPKIASLGEIGRDSLISTSRAGEKAKVLPDN